MIRSIENYCLLVWKKGVLEKSGVIELNKLFLGEQFL
jgi:hypothetical protein